MLLNPALRGKAVAVCGSTENRHGIVLAKSEKAKKAGVKTGQAYWEAKQACPDLIMVPPQYDQYLKFSRLLRAIYLRYTDALSYSGAWVAPQKVRVVCEPSEEPPERLPLCVTCRCGRSCPWR